MFSFLGPEIVVFQILMQIELFRFVDIHKIYVIILKETIQNSLVYKYYAFRLGGGWCYLIEIQMKQPNQKEEKNNGNDC